MKLFYFAIALFWAFIGVGQAPLPKVVQIDESKGLYLNNQVSDVKVDKDGIVWIISFSEIIKYDGKTFTEIKANHVDHSSFLRLNETFDGRKYVGDLDGAVFFVQSDSITGYKYNNQLRKLGLSRTAINVEFFKNGDLLAKPRNNGLIRIKNSGEIEKISGSNGQVFFSISENNKPFLFSYDRSRYDRSRKYGNSNIGAQKQFFSINEDGRKLDSLTTDALTHSYHQSIVKTKNGNYLFSAYTYSIFKVFENGTLKEYPFEYPILNLFVDSQNNLWVSTIENGVYLFRNCNIEESPEQILFPKESRIISSEDAFGNLWGYSEKAGVFKLEESIFSYYQQVDKFNKFPEITSIELVGDSLFFALFQDNLGVLSRKNHEVTILKMPEGEIAPEITINVLKPILDLQYHQKNKCLWIAQGNFIKYFQNNQFSQLNMKPFKDGDEFYNSFNLKINNDKSYSVVGTHSRQIFKLEGNEIDSTSPEFNGRIFGVIYKNDTAYLNTKNGVFRVEKDDFIKIDTDLPELNKKVYDWIIFGEKIWISTKYSGLFSLNKLKYDREIVEDLKIESGRFMQENDSVMWVFSKNATIEIIHSNQSENFKMHRAIPSEVYNGFQIKDSIVYAATVKSGIMKFNINKLRQTTLNAPNYWIFTTRINNKLVKLDSFINKFEYNQNNIKFLYNSPSYDSSNPINYRFKLDGLNNNWTYTSKSEVEFSQLPSNNYIFEIQRRKGQQIWSESEKYTFEILPPFWRTWWFITLVVITIGLITYFLIRVRVRRLSKEKLLTISRLRSEQKALRAKMDPHFMFNVLSSLQYLVSNNQNEKASQFLEQFSSLMRTTLDQTSSELVTIFEEMSFLKEYMEMERLRLEDKFLYSIDIDNNCGNDLLIPNFLIQPFIENAIHHGIKLKKGQGTITLEVKRHGDFIKVVVEDNGLGYKTNNGTKKGKTIQTRKSYGIETVRKRLKLRNGKESVMIQNISDFHEDRTGTRVTVLIKIEKR